MDGVHNRITNSRVQDGNVVDRPDLNTSALVSCVMERSPTRFCDRDEIELAWTPRQTQIAILNGETRAFSPGL
jgi:hypothetical protein